MRTQRLEHLIKERIQHLQSLLRLEQKEEKEQFLTRIGKFNVKERALQGITWYPLTINDWYYDKGERLVIEVERVSNLDRPHDFNSGRLVSFFSNKEGADDDAQTTGTILSMRGNQAKIVLKADNFEDWMKTGKLGLDLLYDETSFKEMEHALKVLSIAEEPRLQSLVDIIYGDKASTLHEVPAYTIDSLNESQNAALHNCIVQEDVAIIHGPPGTGKTTTVIGLVEQLLKEHNQVLVTAPSNNAVDLLVEKLDEKGVNVLRIGNPARINQHIQEMSLSWKVTQHADFSLIKKMKKQSHEFRNMAGKYKRNFGHSEREQRKVLFDEAWKLQKDAQQIEEYITNDLIENAQVIACTLVGAGMHLIRDRRYPVCIIDEASQALEPASWIPISKSRKVIMAGDHKQLPPTVKSYEAEKQGLAISLFEKCIEKLNVDIMLTEQYRMNEAIMQFSSEQFYKGNLEANEHVATHSLDLQDAPVIEFVDTAGCGFDEEHEKTRSKHVGSLFNFHEADILWKHFYELMQALQEAEKPIENYSIGLISPYKGQVEHLKKQLTDFPFPQQNISINTVDGFQGQERDIVYISLVRSNDRNDIGFLKDYRRMNVALTRARKKLVIVGDSATIGNDSFYNAMLEYIESYGAYKTAWEYLYPSD